MTRSYKPVEVVPRWYPDRMAYEFPGLIPERIRTAIANSLYGGDEYPALITKFTLELEPEALIFFGFDDTDWNMVSRIIDGILRSQRRPWCLVHPGTSSPLGVPVEVAGAAS